MSVSCRCQSRGQSLDGCRITVSPGKQKEKKKKKNSRRDGFKAEEMHTDFSKTNNCLLGGGRKKKTKKMKGFIYKSLPQHILHSACPM